MKAVTGPRSGYALQRRSLTLFSSGNDKLTDYQASTLYIREMFEIWTGLGRQIRSGRRRGLIKHQRIPVQVRCQAKSSLATLVPRLWQIRLRHRVQPMESLSFATRQRLQRAAAERNFVSYIEKIAEDT